METTLIACVLTGLTCLTLGTTFGFVLGMVSRLFFRMGFTMFIRENMKNAENNINNQIQLAQNQANGLIAGAHQQVAEIYKDAATQALKASMTNIGPPPPGGLN